MNKNKITPKQEKAIVALIEEPSVYMAAEVSGVNRCTLRRWLRDDGFRYHLMKARHGLIGEATAHMQRMLFTAVDTLARICMDEQVAPGVKVNAAKALIDRAMRGTEIEEFAFRLDRLEKAAEAKKKFDAL